MTPETESRIRSLSANAIDLEDRIALLREKLRGSNLPEERQQINGDLHVAMAVKRKVDGELSMLIYGGESA